MSNKINHWCIICGKGYHACDSCDSVKSFTPWRAIADTVDHYKIYMVIKQYKSNLITKEEARAMLLNIDLTGMGNFKDSVKKRLDEILKEDVPVRKQSKKKAVKDIVEDIKEPIAEDDTKE